MKEQQKQHLIDMMKDDEDLGLYDYVGECTGNNGNGCFMDSCGHNCGCFKRVRREDTQEYDLLQHIKFCLECKNESQAIRLIEKYGFLKQEERYTDKELKLWLKSRDVYLYNHYTTYAKSGIPLQSVEDFIKESHEYLMDREQFKKK